MNGLPGAVMNIHRLVLRAYPPEYLETFGDEMQNTFMDGLEEASEKGEIVSFILREMRDAPRSLVNAYWHGWSRKILNGIEIFQHVTSSSDLPPAQPDGRESRQTYRFATGTVPVHLIKQNNQPLTGCFVISQIPADPSPAGRFAEVHHVGGR